MVSFSAVAKRYPGGKEALREVSFALRPGELAFLTGRTGAGKSTLLKLIPAIERPSAGSVIVNGQNVGALKRSAIPYLRRNLGLVFQDQKLLYDRSVFDNVMLPLRELTEMADKIARPMLERSGGEQVVHRDLHQHDEILSFDVGLLHELGTGAVEHVDVDVGEGPEAAAFDQDRFLGKHLCGLHHFALSGKHGGIGEPIGNQLEAHEPVIQIAESRAGKLDHVHLDAFLDRFAEEYNHRRPHRSSLNNEPSPFWGERLCFETPLRSRRNSSAITTRSL